LATNCDDVHHIKVHSDAGAALRKLSFFVPIKTKHTAGERDLCLLRGFVVVVSPFLAMRAPQKQFPRRLMEAEFDQSHGAAASKLAQEMEPTASLSRSLCVCFFLVCLRILLSTKEGIRTTVILFVDGSFVISGGKKTAGGSAGAAERARSAEDLRRYVALIFAEICHLRLYKKWRFAAAEERGCCYVQTTEEGRTCICFADEFFL
jgi:hypothetical protein